MAFPGIYASIPVLGAFLVIFSGGNAYLNRKVLANKVMVGIGLISYPVYLLHWPVVSYLHVLSGNYVSILNKIIAIAIVLISSVAVYLFLERPLRGKSNRKIKAIVLLVSMLGLFISGHYISQNGVKDRDWIVAADHNENVWDIDDTNKIVDEWIEYGEQCDYSFCSKLKSEKKVAIIGDSHAPTLMVALSRYHNSKGNGVIVAEASGCPPLIGVMSGESSDKPDSWNCNEKLHGYINKIISDVNITTIYLVSRGALYYTGQGFYTEPRYKELDPWLDWNISYYDPNIISSNNQNVYLGSLEKTLELFRRNGKKVIYVWENPELGFQVRKCLKRRNFIIEDEAISPCGVSYFEYQKRTSLFKENVGMVIAQFDNVKTIDLAEALCDGIMCYGMLEGKLLYRDDDHLNLTGADLVISKLKERLDAFFKP